MPQLVGLSQTDAQHILSAAGLRGVKLSFAPSAQGAHGSVILQSPSPGSRISPAGTVELHIAE